MLIETPVWNSSAVGCNALVGHSNSGNDLHLNPASTVYEPSEDTFLVLDALQIDLEHMMRYRLCDTDGSSPKCRPLLVVELGCGAGLLIAAVAKAFNTSDIPATEGTHCVAVDFNPAACHATAETCKLNNVEVEVVCGDLLTWMRPPLVTNVEHKNVYGPIDVLIFNPPYVRGPNGEPARAPISIDTELKSKDLNKYNELLTSMANAAWLGGGPNGVDVLKKALHQAADLLSERGVFYVIMVKYNYNTLFNDEMIARRTRTEDPTVSLQYSPEFLLLTTFGKDPLNKPLACRPILARHIRGEQLAVFRIYRPHILDSMPNAIVDFLF